MVGWVMAISGPLFLIGALVAYTDTRMFIARAVRTEGIVVEMVAGGLGSHITNAPVFTFSDDSGVEYTTLSALDSTPPTYKVGEKITVLYDPDNPTNAKIEGLFGLWGIPLILAAIGGVECLLGAVSIAAGRWLSRRPEE